MIVKTALISNASHTAFCNGVTKTIDIMQGEGLKVEVQYQPIKMKDEFEYVLYTAYLVGRKKGGAE